MTTHLSEFELDELTAFVKDSLSSFDDPDTDSVESGSYIAIADRDDGQERGTLIPRVVFAEKLLVIRLYPEPKGAAASTLPQRPIIPPQQPMYDGVGVAAEEYTDSRPPAGPPVCPVHRVPMVVSKYADKKTGRIGWYCREQARGDEPSNPRGYCSQQVAG